jgi:hypothetical protein
MTSILMSSQLDTSVALRPRRCAQRKARLVNGTPSDGLLPSGSLCLPISLDGPEAPDEVTDDLNRMRLHLGLLGSLPKGIRLDLGFYQ